MKPTFRTLKIDDEGALRALVLEHLDSLETGLRVKGERVLVGRNAVDLVAVDARNRLVLIAIALDADDAMIVRMLAAFARCLENPDAVCRLYSVDRTALAAPPRVMFVSERVPDNFLQKVGYLKMPSIDCREFRYLEVDGVAGLYCNPVVTRTPDAPGVAATAGVASEPASVMRETPMPEPLALRQHMTAVQPVTVDTPDPSAPVTSPTPTAAPTWSRPPLPTKEALSGDSPNGLRIPPNLRSQWRRILDRALDAPDPAKIAIVRQYLQTEFPGSDVSDFYDRERGAQMFHVDDRQGDLVHATAVSGDFLETEAARDIRGFLDGHGLGRVLRDAGATTVFVSPSGLQISPR